MDQDNTVTSSSGDSASDERPAADLPLQCPEVGSSGQDPQAMDWFERLAFEQWMTALGWRWKYNPPAPESSSEDSSSEEEDASSVHSLFESDEDGEAVNEPHRRH